MAICKGISRIECLINEVLKRYHYVRVSSVLDLPLTYGIYALKTFIHFRLVAVSCDCYITTGSGMMNSVDTVTYHYKAALLLLIYSMLTSFILSITLSTKGG